MKSSSVPRVVIEEMLSLLRQRVRDRFLPPDVGDHFIPRKNFRGPLGPLPLWQDCFIVRYSCSGWKIQIDDGYCLSFLVRPSARRTSNETIQDFIRRVASDFLNLPERLAHTRLEPEAFSQGVTAFTA